MSVLVFKQPAVIANLAYIYPFGVKSAIYSYIYDNSTPIHYQVNN